MEIIVYSLKVAVVLIAFYLLYKLFMSRETFLRTNRIIILTSLTLSFILPFCGLNFNQSVAENGNYTVTQSVIMLEAVIVGDNASQNIFTNWRSIVVFLYFVGIAVCFLRIIISIIRVIQLINKGERKALENGTKLIIVDESQAPFSWIKYIIISRTDYEENKEEILTHECAHIRYYHSIDLLVSDLFCCLQWFNPAAWLIRNELAAVHEYEADKAVLDSGINAKQYQILLIKKAAGAKWYSIANSFNHKKLKYRIAMMLRKQSSSWARAKVLYALPIVAFSMIAFANLSFTKDEGNNFGNTEFTYDQEMYESLPKGKSVKFIGLDKNGNRVPLVKEADGTVRMQREDEKPKTGKKISRPLEHREIPEDEVFMIVEIMPEFPGGELELRKFIEENIVYPEDAKAQGVEGTCFVKFVIDVEGSIKDVELISGIGFESIDDEAIRVIKSMPKWTPGKQRGQNVNVSFVIPITFTL